MNEVGRPPLIRRSMLGGFTLIEVLVTMAVLSVFAILLLSVTDSTFKIWRSTSTSVTMFAAARTAYDTLTRRLAQATVNTYLDYYDAAWDRRAPGDTTFVPDEYGRASDLAYVSGPAASILPGNASVHPGHGVFFFAPLGFTDNSALYADLPNLLNACGYYIEWGSDKDRRPSFLDPLPERWRFRLIENVQPSQDFTSYPEFTNDSSSDDRNWITGGLDSNSISQPIAENIIALILRPELPEQDAKEINPAWNPWDITETYTYDSRTESGRTRANDRDALQFAQLPPMLRVVMVAVDDAAAARVTGTSTTPPAALRLAPEWFQDPDKLDADLAELSAKLVDEGIPFRIFNQLIPLRGAKYTAQKEN